MTSVHDPLDPSRAVLDLEFMNYYAFALFGMSFFIIAGLGLIVVDAWLWLLPAESDDVTPHFPQGLVIVGAIWFFAHVLSILALGVTGCDQPDRAALVGSAGSRRRRDSFGHMRAALRRPT